MGQLMALALLCTMMAAVLFQPALMGPPREVARDEPLPVPAEPELEPAPAMASWAVERIGPAAKTPLPRAVRIGLGKQEEHEKEMPHEVEH
jgi:hypothetical protein